MFDKAFAFGIFALAVLSTALVAMFLMFPTETALSVGYIVYSEFSQ